MSELKKLLISVAVFAYKYRVSLLMLYLVGALFFLAEIESVWNGGFYFSVRVLALPFALLIFGTMWLGRKFFYPEAGSVRKAWLLSIGWYLFPLLMTWPYLMAVNAATSNGKKIVYSGRIERKWIHHGRGGQSYQIDLLNSATSSVITLTIPERTYASLREGEIFTSEFIRGGFGIPYRWRFRN